MKKDRTSQIMTVIAISIGVLALSVGFSAFSQTLTIKSSAEVKPNSEDFKVEFSTKQDTVSTDPVEPVVTGTTDGASATNATIDTDNNNLLIKNLHAVFTKPGQKAEYTFYSKNTGKYLAYLNSVAFANVSGETSTKKCTARYTTGDNAVTPALMNAACSDIRVTVKANNTLFTESVASITGHSVAVDAAEEIIVTIEYLDNNHIADGPFDIAFGDITLAYSSVD